MSIFTRKVKNKYKCSIQIQQLSEVPYSNSFLYCKLRQISFGKFEARTKKQEIKNNCVVWNEEFNFELNLREDPSVELPKLQVRISIRQELPGARDEVKLGYVDITMGRFYQSESDWRHVLTGYEKASQRCDNSVLLITALVEPLPSGKQMKDHSVGASGDAATSDKETVKPKTKPTHSRTSSGASGYSSSNNSLHRLEASRVTNKQHNRMPSWDMPTDPSTCDDQDLENEEIVEKIMKSLRSTSR